MNLKKLEKTFQINPLYESDGYKVGHSRMLAPNTTRLAGNWIPRSLKYMHPSITEIMSAGQQVVVRYLHSVFAENFFIVSLEGRKQAPKQTLEQFKEKALKFISDMSLYLGIEYNGEHFEDLWELGYLPIEIQSLPEGIFTKPNIPHMTFINTVDGYAWLTLFLETLISKLAWQMPTVATISHKFRSNADEWVTKTDPANMWLTDFMCHDFHSRGGNPFTSIVAGLGHALSNKGSDTLNVIPAARYYYDFDENNVPIFSVNASEHSVTCTQLFYYQDRLKRGLEDETIKHFYSFDLPCEGSVENPDYLAIAEYMNLKDWLQRFPKGILSYVGDTMNLWKVVTHVVTRLKSEILARDGKLVIRPDSGDPVDIICGAKFHPIVDDGNPARKGVIELLWDIFRGTVNEQGYKLLDPHIGAIYGDSINLERQVQIYERLANKGFAATNIVLGIGSYSMVYMTRDQAGWAAKGAWFETVEIQGDGEDENQISKHSFNIYKDPITDDGTKKSLKGFQFVYLDENGEYKVEGEVSEEKSFSEENLLKTIYKNGEFFNQTTLEEIRERLKKT